MKHLPNIKDYYEIMNKLPLKASYTREELMIPEFLVEAEKEIELYYCTHNEYMNPRAKVFIIGITPGFTQMSKSISTARACIEENKPLEEMVHLCKKEGRLAGVLRKNVGEMLEALDLPNGLGVESAKVLFDEREDLLHTTSMIPFAAFVKGKNYTGHSPQLLKSDFLMSYVEAHFYPQIEVMQEALIIPLGRCVEEVIKGLIAKGKVDENKCLLGFPHPSGANVNRKKQFEEEKQQLLIKVKQFCK